MLQGPVPVEPVVSLLRGHKVLMARSAWGRCVDPLSPSDPPSRNQTPSKGMSGCELKLSSPSASCRRSLSQCDSRAKGLVNRSRLAAHPACVLWLVVSVCGSHSCMMRGWRQAAFPWEQLFTWVCSYFKAHWLLCVFV